MAVLHIKNSNISKKVTTQQYIDVMPYNISTPVAKDLTTGSGV